MAEYYQIKALEVTTIVHEQVGPRFMEIWGRWCLRCSSSSIPIPRFVIRLSSPLWSILCPLRQRWYPVLLAKPCVHLSLWLSAILIIDVSCLPRHPTYTPLLSRLLHPGAIPQSPSVAGGKGRQGSVRKKWCGHFSIIG